MTQEPINEQPLTEQQLNSLAEQAEAGKITPQEAIKQINATFASINQQIAQEPTFTAALERFASATKPVFEETLKIARHVCDVMYQAYLEDGAIYGESHDGLMRWMNELSEAKNLRAKAERIEQHQDTAAK